MSKVYQAYLDLQEYVESVMLEMQGEADEAFWCPEEYETEESTGDDQIGLNDDKTENVG